MKTKEKKESDESNVQYVPVVDGGWGWVVVLGSFFIHVFVDGIVYSFGILLEIIMKEFNASNAKASVIISLLTGATLATGPIASAITNKFGCRVTTILGSLIATMGCAISYYATSVEYLMVSVGCVMGIGFGLMYCPAIVIVTMYFEKKRAMATGIAVCGAGVGTVLFAPITEKLIEASWRTVFVVYAAIVSICSLCGATFRPLTFVAVEHERRKMKVLNGNEKIGSVDVDKQNAPLPNMLFSSHSHQNIIDLEAKNGELESDISHQRSRGVSESTGFITVKVRCSSILIFLNFMSRLGHLKILALYALIHSYPRKNTGYCYCCQRGRDYDSQLIHQQRKNISSCIRRFFIQDVFYTGSMSELSQVERRRSLASLNTKDDKLKSLEEMVINQEEEEKINKTRDILRFASNIKELLQVKQHRSLDYFHFYLKRWVAMKVVDKRAWEDTFV